VSSLSVKPEGVEPITISLTKRLSVRLYRDHGPNFLETGPLHKGLVLLLDGKELVEEGVGFGVPVAKYSDKTFFSSSAEVSVNADGTLCKVYTLDTVSIKKFGKATYINDGLYSPLRKAFHLLYLKNKRLNKVFNKIMELRNFANIKTDFVTVKPRGKVTVTYRCHSTGIKVTTDFSKLTLKTCNELLILNEQGSSVFQIYTDSKGKTVNDNKIGAWDEVNAKEAWLLNPGGLVSFGVVNKAGARLFRGWEHTRNRFSWAGISYSLPPQKSAFEYTVSLRCES
jgi:hypothetical protein